MVERFEKTGSLKVHSIRRRKFVSQDTIKKFATAAIVGRSLENIAGTSSAREVARSLYISYCTV